MQLIKDTFLVRADKNLHKTLNIKGHDGAPLILDTDFNNYEHSTQVGEVAYVPAFITEDFTNDNPVVSGDKIIFHHFVVQPDNALFVSGEELFKCEYYQIWCKIEDEKIMPLEDFIFVEPILEPEENMFGVGGYMLKPHRENLKNQGIVFAASRSAQANGVKSGDKVFFTKDADYDIKIGKLLWRMRTRNIIAIERDGEVLPLKDRMMVKEVPESVSESELILINQKQREKKGEVIHVGDEMTGINKGASISYFHGLSSKLKHKGVDYAFINKESVNYIQL